MEQSAHSLRLEQAWPADLVRLRRMHRALKRRRGSLARREASRARYEQTLAESIRVYAARRANVPDVSFDFDLPVLKCREKISAAIAGNRVVVVCGETGSGKSTQLPKICLAAGRGIDGFIGHTQPRRIAARSVATRIAEEIGSPLGQDVGYKIRFQDETTPTTYVKMMTDGILLAEAQGDPWFDRYDTMIIDEAHERSLNIDLLLGLLRRVVQRRSGFRLIITSATIDADRFSHFFALSGTPAPVIEVSGRGYPVETRYQSPESRWDGEEAELPRRVADAAENLFTKQVGDTLVFLPTERDIRETSRLLRGRLATKQVEIVPLYARLSSKEQQRVFKRGKMRRIVLATNVAESSLTVPGIRAVIDTGTARIARFSAKSRIQRLPIEPISQASANQRAGRCGRIGPGVCVRLYSKDDFESRSPYTVPEIRRTNLAATVLRLLTLRLGDVDDLPLLDRPRPDAVREARKTLHELQAIDQDGSITSLGETVGRMPVDPRVGRMILAADQESCLAEVLIIAAAIETQDPRERPVEKQEAAEACHDRFADARSDFLSYLKLWDHLRQMRSDLTGSRFRKECVKQFLSVPKVLEWEDVHRQLVTIVRQQGLKLTPRSDGYGAIHRSLLTGLLSGIAVRRGDDGYQSASGPGFQLWPGSSLKSSQPKWVVAAETVETSHRFLRNAARIRPEWLPRLANHLTDKHYRDPHWSYKQQAVLAHERLTLFDLPLSGRKTVPYGPIDSATSREVFIREALVHEGLRGDWEFVEHNRYAVEELRRIDAKARLDRPLVDEGTLFEFYNERIPQDVWDVKSFRRWFRRADSREEGLLMLRAESLERVPPDFNREDFPDYLDTTSGRLPVRYTHSRGTSGDGITLIVPVDLAGTLDARRIDWAVPGLLRERIIGLIRLLPKPLRTRLVPAPDVADRVCQSLVFGEGEFAATLADALSQEAATKVAESDLLLDRLPDHLRLNIRLENSDGACVAESRDLAQVRRRLGLELGGSSRFIPDDRWNEEPVTDWTFGELPSAATVIRGTHSFEAFPGLLDMGDAVSPRMFADREDAEISTRQAVRRLFILRHSSDLLTQVDWLPEWDQLSAGLKRVDPERDFRQEVAELLAFRALAAMPCLPRTREEYEDLRNAAHERITLAAQEITKPVLSVVRTLIEAHDLLNPLVDSGHSAALTDIRAQLAALLPVGFLAEVSWDRLQHFPRYLRGIAVRLRRIAERGSEQDRGMHERVQCHTDRLRELTNSTSGRVIPSEVDKYRWMIEEYRVSVFAQQLGTAETMSAKRLDRQWARCRHD